jgi:hypothetical protein
MPRTTYFTALKKWNEQRNTGMTCSPKKGTEEYNEVIKIFNELKSISNDKKDENKEVKSRGKPRKAKVEEKQEIQEKNKFIYTEEQKQYLKEKQQNPYEHVKELDKGKPTESKTILKLRKQIKDDEDMLKNMIRTKAPIDKKDKLVLKIGKQKETLYNLKTK